MALLPLLEMGWHTASTFKLVRYADLQHPLLKELLTKSPATYQHTMTVAYLAQSVGEAIGANTVLLRIGAYYHDIGKVADPRFFRENQSGENPHDDLDPHESARIIIDHVINPTSALYLRIWGKFPVFAAKSRVISRGAFRFGLK
jgi:putative nucleotidyltransferase with HDIG domain